MGHRMEAGEIELVVTINARTSKDGAPDRSRTCNLRLSSGKQKIVIERFNFIFQGLKVYFQAF